MRKGLDYPQLIKSLKEEIQSLKSQLSQGAETIKNQSFSPVSNENLRKEALIQQCRAEIQSLKAQIQSQKEVLKSLNLRVKLMKKIGLDEQNSEEAYSRVAMDPRESGSQSGLESVRNLAQKLRSQIREIESKTKSLTGGSFISEESSLSRPEQASMTSLLSSKTANEQFTLLQKRVSLMESRNSTLRERLKTTEAEKGRLEGSYQSALARVKGGDEELKRRTEELEGLIQEQDQALTSITAHIHQAKTDLISSVAARSYESKKPVPEEVIREAQLQYAETHQALEEMKENARILQEKVVLFQGEPKKTGGVQALTGKLKAEILRIETDTQEKGRIIRLRDKDLLALELKCEQIKAEIGRLKGESDGFRSNGTPSKRPKNPSPSDRSQIFSRAKDAMISYQTAEAEIGNISKEIELKELEIDSAKEKYKNLQNLYEVASNKKPGIGKRSGSWSSLRKFQKSDKSPIRPVGLASKIVALNRGQFESLSPKPRLNKS